MLNRYFFIKAVEIDGFFFEHNLCLTIALNFSNLKALNYWTQAD